MTLFGIAMLVVGIGLSVSMGLKRRSALPTALFFYHLLFALYGWDYTLTNGGDSVGYYLTEVIPEPYPGTHFVQWLTASIRELFGATYLDLFMFFHLPGYLGIVTLFDLLSEIAKRSDAVRRMTVVLIFIPGIHFWTSSIGKDSLSFLGITMLIASAARTSRISTGAAAGLAICAMVRPHIAMILGTAWGTALFFGANSGRFVRLLTLGALTGAGILAAPSVLDYLRIETMDVDSINSYVEARQNSNLGGGSSVDIANYPFPLQFFTLMFRPLFFDSGGGLGLIASAENAIYLGLLIWASPRAIPMVFGSGSSAFLRMNAFFWFVTVSLLGSTIANLGLAIRQKVMVVPSFLILTLTGIAAAKQAQASAQAAAPSPPLGARTPPPRLAARPSIPIASRKST